MKGLGTNVVVDYMSSTFDTLDNDTMDVVFDTLASRRAVPVEGNRAVLLGLCRSSPQQSALMLC